MDTCSETVARSSLLAASASLLLLLLTLPSPQGVASPLLLHHQFLIGLLALALLGAVRLPALRPAVLAAGLLCQGGWVGALLLAPGAGTTPAWSLSLAGLAALLCAAALSLHAARRQARWEGRSRQARGA